MLARCKFGRGYGAGEPAAGCKGGGVAARVRILRGGGVRIRRGVRLLARYAFRARAVCGADVGHVEGQSSAGGRATPGRCAMAGG